MVLGPWGDLMDFFSPQDQQAVLQCSVNRLRAQPHKTGFLSDEASPGCLCFWLPSYKLEVAVNSSLGLINLLAWPTELREAFTYITGVQACLWNCMGTNLIQAQLWGKENRLRVKLVWARNTEQLRPAPYLSKPRLFFRTGLRPPG